MSRKKEFVEFSIRVPVELNGKIETEAKNEQRNKNQQVNRILEKHYEAAEPEQSASAA